MKYDKTFMNAAVYFITALFVIYAMRVVEANESAVGYVSIVEHPNHDINLHVLLRQVYGEENIARQVQVCVVTGKYLLVEQQCVTNIKAVDAISNSEWNEIPVLRETMKNDQGIYIREGISGFIGLWRKTDNKGKSYSGLQTSVFERLNVSESDRSLSTETNGLCYLTVTNDNYADKCIVRNLIYDKETGFILNELIVENDKIVREWKAELNASLDPRQFIPLDEESAIDEVEIRKKKAEASGIHFEQIGTGEFYRINNVIPGSPAESSGIRQGQLISFIYNPKPTTYSGIGVMLDTPADPDAPSSRLIKSVIDESPAASAGIKGGDEIVAIDGESVIGMPLRTLVQMIRGKPGSGIIIDVYRDGEPLTFPLRREDVNLGGARERIKEAGSDRKRR